MTRLPGSVVAATVALTTLFGTVSAQEAYRLSLGDAARLGAAHGSGVREAEAGIEGAEARVREATGDLLPHLDAGGLWGARTFNTASFGLEFPTEPGRPPLFDPDGEVIGPVWNTDLRAYLDVPLLDLAALGRRRSAQARVEASRGGAEVAAARAAEAAARSYLIVLRFRAGVVAREQDVALAEELLDVARGLVEAGVGVAIDETRAESQLATVEAQLLAARNQVDAAELALRRDLRLDPDAPLTFVDDLEMDPAGWGGSAQEAVAQAWARRPELSQAEAVRVATDESLAAVRAERIPRLSATLDDGFFGKDFRTLLNTYTWSLNVRVPVFDGLRRSARADEHEAELRALGYRIDDLRQDVAFEVRQALLDFRAATQQVEAATERERLAQLEVDQEAERARAGVTGTADVVRAAQRLNEARTGRLNALWAMHAARVSLAAAMGGVTDLP